MDFRIAKKTVVGMDDASLFWALIERMWHADVDEHVRMRLATPGQRALYTITWCFREVANGGFNQFFYNTGGNHTDVIRNALRELGADEHADAFETALTAFPRSNVPVEVEVRRALLESIPKNRRLAVFEPVEKTFFNEENIWPFFREYVEKHENEFFSDS
jgi:hypothetical protein